MARKKAPMTPLKIIKGICPVEPIKRSMRQGASNGSDGAVKKVGSGVAELVRADINDEVQALTRKGMALAMHAGRTKLMRSDIETVMAMEGRSTPLPGNINIPIVCKARPIHDTMKIATMGKISKDAVALVQLIMTTREEEVARRAALVTKHSNRSILGPGDVQLATKSMKTGEMEYPIKYNGKD